ncbi:MAG: ECF transporter S component [Nitrososphaerota archaeon]
MRTIKQVAAASCLASLAALLAVLPLSFPFPIIPYLKFDLAEVPVFLAFLTLGPSAGVFSAAVYWLVLLFVGAFSPLGPTMKFAAVLSTLIGLWAGFKLRPSRGMGFILGIIFGCIIRVILMSVFNYLVLVYMFPGFLEFAAASISAFLGLRIVDELAALPLIMIFTAIFNVLHVPLSIIPAYLVVKSLIKVGESRGGAYELWYARLARVASKRSPQRS